MTILTTEQAIEHCRADPVADASMMALYLGAAEEVAQDYLGRKVYASQEDLDVAQDETGMVANFAFRAAALLICGHLFLNRENVATGVTVQALPMGAHDLLRPHRRSFGL
jgi:hypothetical protein